MNCITRQLINPNFVLYEFDRNLNQFRTTTRDQLFAIIDRWKILLLEKYNAQAGESAFIQGHPGADYYGAAFALWELGITNILDLPRCYTEADVTGTKTQLFGMIDYMIRTNSETDLFGAPIDNSRWVGRPYFKWEVERDLRQGKNIVSIDEFNAYQTQDAEKYANVSDVILCTPESTLIKFPTSGTTGDPRLIYDSHDKIYKLTQRYLRTCTPLPTDRALHQNNLNHGSTLMIHWLPSFMTCHEHYNMDPTNFDNLVKLTADYKINRMILYTVKTLTDWLTKIPPVDYPVTIQTLYQITPEMVELVKEKNIDHIYGNFGATDIGGFFFLKHATPATDLAAYEVSNMGQPHDDFWSMEIREGKLWVKSDQLGSDWATSGDLFEIRNGNYYFMGRADRFRIGDEWLDLNTVEKFVNLSFGEGNADIIIDSDLQKIYLAIWKNNYIGEQKMADYFKTNFRNIKIDYTVADQAQEQFHSGRKVDNSKVRDYCRKQLKLDTFARRCD